MKSIIIYVDMDNVLVDFESGIQRLDKNTAERYEGKYDEVPGIFALMDPMENAIESYEQLAASFDTYILSTSPWNNPTASNDKLEWVKKYLGKPAYKRLILSHHKNLNNGHYLIDDRPLHNGANKFSGTLIHFGSADFADWTSVMLYFSKYLS